MFQKIYDYKMKFIVMINMSFCFMLSNQILLADTYLREDQEYANITLYQEDAFALKIGTTVEAKFLRDMQDYYTANNLLRRDNYQILGKIRLKSIYNINDDSKFTAYISTNLNYKGMKQFDSALTVDKTYIVYDNTTAGSITVGSVNGLYSEVALWSNVAGLTGGTAHVPTYAKMSLIGIDGALNSIQYRKEFVKNITIGAEFTTPDVSYRTGGDPTNDLCRANPEDCNFRGGMERKEATALSMVYDNGTFGIGAVYHFARLAHTHNQPNYEGDVIRDIRYRTYNSDGVLAAKMQQGRVYYSAGVSYENVIGRWKGESVIGDLVSRHHRYGFNAGIKVDYRENNVGFIPSLEYNLSRTKEKAGIVSSDTHNVENISINDNYTFPNLDIGNSLSEKRADSGYTNKIVGNIDYYFNKNSKLYVSYAHDLRSKSKIHNISGGYNLPEYQVSIGLQLMI